MEAEGFAYIGSNSQCHRQFKFRYSNSVLLQIFWIKVYVEFGSTSQ